MSDSMKTVENEAGELVEAAIFVGYADGSGVLKEFPMTKRGYDEAVAFISTLENYQSGDYYLDCPIDPEMLPSDREIHLSLSEYEASILTGALEEFSIAQGMQGYEADDNTASYLRGLILDQIDPDRKDHD